MPDEHNNGHDDHDHSHLSGTRLLITMVLNLVITTVEVIGGLLSGSLSLLSDAMHNFSDAFAIVLSYVAIRMSRWSQTERYTFGFKRAETLAAIINTVVLVAISIMLIIEAVKRFYEPEHVKGLIMIAVAGVGLIANVAGTLLLKKGAGESINIKSTYLHLLSDAVTSVGVIIGGVLIYFFRITVIDPILTIVISIYIVKESASILKDGVNILMMGTPPGISLEAIQQDIEGMEHVDSLHHAHMWMLTENMIHFEAHIEIPEMSTTQATELIAAIEKRLQDTFRIDHVTLQFETTTKCDSKALLQGH